MSIASIRVVWTACALITAACCVSSSTIAFTLTLNTLSNWSLPVWRAQANVARRKSACEPAATDNRRPFCGLAASLNPIAFELSNVLAHS
eukprot:1747266-Pleurochrysis_carterae.AAC.1